MYLVVYEIIYINDRQPDDQPGKLMIWAVLFSDESAAVELDPVALVRWSRLSAMC